MKIESIYIVALLLSISLHAATVNFAQDSVNDATGTSIPAVSSSQYLETATSYTTITAPASWSDYHFTHWSNSSYPATIYRDAWGRSLNPIPFTLLEDTIATAHYLPAALDSDGDGVPDWYEMEYYGNLSQGVASDTDGDGISLLAEYSGGTHPLYGNSQQAGGVAYANSSLVSFNRAGYAKYTLRSVPTGTVNQAAIAPPGTVVTTPDLTANTAFGYWTLDGVRQQDAWGVAYPQITFTMESTNREAVAYLFTGDTDGDGVPDAYEQYYYGTLANNQNSDTDGDGITLLAERSGGTNPLYANTRQDGGVAWADSALVTVNLAGFSRYTLASDPPGTVNQSAIVPDGTVITTPEMAQSTFGYWTLDGVPQRDAWGAGLRQLSFTVDGADRLAVARHFSSDTDGDTIPDAWEQYHFGTLAYATQDAPGGSGWSLLAAYQSGASPLFPQSHQDGGVAWTDSATVVVNLQPFERLSKMLIGGVLTDFFSPDPNGVSGIQAGTWSATAVTDWDGDGDPDLFIAHEGGLRIFRHIGTARNPNLEEITTGFAALEAYVAGIERPVIAGGDWNGDGLGDLVIGGNTGTLRLIASGGAFTSNASGLDLTLPTTRTSPALGDVNVDGRADLLVLLDDGTVSFFPNNGTAVPFSGSGSANFLGTPAPDGTSIAVGDINQDGLPDLLLADSDGRIWEFINNGSGGFSLQSKVWGGSYPGFAAGLTLATVDIEGDGDLDLIAGLANGGIIALRDPSVGRPTGLIARPGANSVQLDWDPNWQSRIRGYYVYRAIAEAGPFAKLLADYVPLPSYLDSPVDPSILHYYYVTGVSQFFLPGNSTPRIVESLPSDLAITQTGKVILSLRPARASPGNVIKINLSIENAMGITGNGMQLRVAYDAAKLTPSAQAQTGGETVLSTGLSRNLAFTDNGASASGELIINGTGGELEPGSGKLFTLQFKVAAGLPDGTILPVTISSATLRGLNGNLLAVEILHQAPSRVGSAFIEGDLDGDGLVSNADKILLMTLIPPTTRAPTAEQLMAGDLNGDGKIDEKDLVLLMQLLNVP